jgi:hypothetical protein
VVASGEVLLIGRTIDEVHWNKKIEECPGFDPYIVDEADPEKSRAVESSLWELEVTISNYFSNQE